jgi:hypothetical protein
MSHELTALTQCFLLALEVRILQMTQSWRKTCHYFLFVVLTLTFPEFLLSLFHDADQGSSPQNESRTTPASAVEGMPANENTPIGQQLLFTHLDSHQSDNVEDVDDKHINNLCQIYNQSQELDMDLVNEEANEDSDGDSNCSAAKADVFCFRPRVGK